MMQQKPGGLASLVPKPGLPPQGQPPQGMPAPPMPPGLPQGFPPVQPGSQGAPPPQMGQGQQMNMIPPQLLAQILQLLMGSGQQGAGPQQPSPVPENMQFNY
jgi:hypothetical protein